MPCEHKKIIIVQITATKTAYERMKVGTLKFLGKEPAERKINVFCAECHEPVQL